MEANEMEPRTRDECGQALKTWSGMMFFMARPFGGMDERSNDREASRLWDLS